MLQAIGTVAPSTVLLRGQTGTGKEMLASHGVIGGPEGAAADLGLKRTTSKHEKIVSQTRSIGSGPVLFETACYSCRGV